MGRIDYPGVYIEETSFRAHHIEGVPTSTAAFMGPVSRERADHAIHISSLTDVERELGPSADSSPMHTALRLFFENGGSKAVAVGLGSNAPEAITRGALGALDEEPFELLCLPGLYGDGPPTNIPAIATALDAAAGYCHDRRAILLVDPAPEWGSAADVVAGLAAIRAAAPNLHTENAAVFFPNLLVGTLERSMPVGPAGAIAGLMARTDRSRGIWKAPTSGDAAIAGVVGVAAPIDTNAASTLASVGVNTIRYFEEQGTLPWGVRLLSSGSRAEPEWKYIPIRRLLAYLERSLDEGLRWVVFEPNNDALWARVRQQIDEFLYQLFKDGAFVGLTADQAYFVKCGPDTMTQGDIDSGVLNVLVGFAPVRPAEFVTLRIGLQVEGAAR